jgi:hypothetical protein
VFCPKNMLKISRARPKGPVSHSSVTGQRSFSFLCCRFRNRTPGPPPFSVDEFGRRGAPSSGNGLIYRRILVSFCKIYYYNVYISFNSTARPLCYRRPPRCDFFGCSSSRAAAAWRSICFMPFVCMRCLTCRAISASRRSRKLRSCSKNSFP